MSEIEGAAEDDVDVGEQVFSEAFAIRLHDLVFIEFQPKIQVLRFVAKTLLDVPVGCDGLALDGQELEGLGYLIRGVVDCFDAVLKPEE